MNWDTQLLAFFNQDLAHPFLDGLMVILTVGAIPLLALGPFFFLRAGKRREGSALLATFVVSTLLAVGLQFLLMRPRPIDIRVVQPPPTFPSFPSGHAAAVFGGATLICLIWRRAGFIVIPAAVLVSCSRIYLGHHYPSDVLGGAILGISVATAVYGCWYRPSGASRPRWAWLFWSQAAVVLLASLAAYLGLLHVDYLAHPGTDKLLHFLLPGVLALLAVGWWAGYPPGTILGVLGLLATAEEALQTLSPARSFDILDLAATLSGIAFFGWLGTIWDKRSRPADQQSRR